MGKINNRNNKTVYYDCAEIFLFWDICRIHVIIRPSLKLTQLDAQQFNGNGQKLMDICG